MSGAESPGEPPIVEDPSVSFGRKQGYGAYRVLVKLGMRDQLLPDQLVDRSVSTAAQFHEPPVPFDARLAAHGLRTKILEQEMRELE